MTIEHWTNFLSAQEIEQDLSKIKEHLITTQGLWADHIKDAHGGVVIPTTCHKCGNFRCGINADEALIQDLESARSRR